MDTFFRFIGFLSPSKRRRTVGPGTPTQQTTPDHLYHPLSEPQDKKARATLQARIDRKYTLYADTRFGPGSRKRDRDEGEDLDARDELNSPSSSILATGPVEDSYRGYGEAAEGKDEGEVGSDNSSDVVSPGDSASQITPVEDSAGELEGEEYEPALYDNMGEGDEEAEDESLDVVGWQAEQETTAQRKVQEYLARQAELMSRQEEFKKNIAGGKWHSDELYLFDRLSMRSFEPIFPLIWQLDLPTLNPALFSKGNTFFNSNHTGREFAIKVLLRLFDLGVRVKDLAKYTNHCVPLLTREINQVVKWSEWDGGYKRKRFIPILTILSAKPTQDSDTILKILRDQMGFLARKHREHLALDEPRVNENGEVEVYSRPPPIIYGIILVQTMAVFSTLDSSIPDAKTKHIAHFDFKQAGHSVWNGMAVAIIVIMARNYTMSMLDTLEDDDPESDPDL